MNYPKSIQDLIDYFSKLPSVGPKTAERFVFYLLKQPQSFLDEFAAVVSGLKKNIIICGQCLGVSGSNPCSICADKNRNKKTICVVANTRDMISVENTKQYGGVYHILGGVINAIEGVKPEHLTFKKLLEKIKNNKAEEIILALNPDIEGETTSLYLAKILSPLKKNGLKITRIARGLPMGSDLEYADSMTISNALKYRNEV